MIGAPLADARASPNFGPRRAGGSIDLLLLHYTAMQNVEAALQRLCDPIQRQEAKVWQAPNWQTQQRAGQPLRSVPVGLPPAT